MIEPTVGSPDCTNLISFMVINPETTEATEVLLQVDFENIFLDARQTQGYRIKGEQPIK